MHTLPLIAIVTDWFINAVPFITRHLYGIFFLHFIYMGVYTIVSLNDGPVYSIVNFENGVKGWIIYPFLLLGVVTALFFPAKYLSFKKNHRFNFIEQRHVS